MGLRCLLLLAAGALAGASQCTEYPSYPSGSQNVTIAVDGKNRTFQRKCL
jgi:hypothetical protein